jgi:hypothetical protein
MSEREEQHVSGAVRVQAVADGSKKATKLVVVRRSAPSGFCDLMPWGKARASLARGCQRAAW